ncbi:uncharacterized protein LOC143258767 [Megalopta genalis]|uniref:uncharacterized protein LOC143258767 n=1 Tax=Megalopta genalis TaxID=115081 RepID=UPI003FD1B367
MTKFLKSKFDNQLDANQILKKKLNFVKHKKNFCKSRNHTRTNILQEQDAISLNNKFVSNDNIMNTKRNINGEPIQAAMSLRSKQNENSSSQIQLSSNVEANYSKNYNCFSQSVVYSSALSTDSSNDDTRKSLKSRQTHLNTPMKKQSNRLPQNRNNRNIIHTRIEEPLLGFSQEKKNITTTKNLESMRTARMTKTNEDLVPSYRQLRSSLPQMEHAFNQKNLQTDNTQLSVLTTDFLKTYTSELTHLKNNCEKKTDITVPNFTNDRTLQAYVNITKYNDDINSLSEKKCLVKPLENRMRTRSMAQAENISNQTDQKSQKITSAFSAQRKWERPNKEKHVIELKEETIVQQNLQMTTHFHSKSDTFSCNLHGNNPSCDKAIQGNENHSILNIKQQKLHCLVRENKRKPSLELCKNRNIAETILQTNLQHLVNSNLKDDCDISMEVNKKNECEINKSIKIEKTKTDVHRSIKKKEIIKSECHIDVKKKGQHPFNPSNKCKHSAFKTMKKTLVSTKINKKKLIGSLKDVTQASNRNIKIIKNFKNNRELIIPLVKLEYLSVSEITQLIHTPRYIENKIKNSGKKEMQYTVKNIRKENCTIRKQYKVTKIKKNDQFNKVHNSIKKCEDQTIDDLHKNKEGSMCPTQDVNNFTSIDRLTTQRLEEQVVNRDNNTSSLFSTEEHFTTTAVYQRDSKNELTVIKTAQSVLNKECSYFNDSIKQENNVENQSSELEGNECDISTNNEVDKAETLQDNNSHLQTNELLENIYKFYLKNKIKGINNSKKTQMEEYIKEDRGMPTIIAICVKCKEILNLMLQFSAKTNFTRDEPLQIECVVCNVHMYSVSRFQQHLMDVHLQCENNEFLRTKKRYIVDIIHFNMDKENSKYKKYKCCCCLRVFDRQGTFKQHLTRMHNTSCQFLDKVKKCEHVKKEERPKKCLYSCEICSIKYKEKRSLLSHMSKHTMDSKNVKKELQEILQDNNVSEVENNAHLPGTYIKDLNDRPNDTLSSVMNKDLEEANCNTTAEEIIPEKFNNSNNDSAFRMWRTGVKRQKLMRKLRRDTTAQQTVCCEQEEIRCKLCDKEFNSFDLLKEHMFFLHDSVLEDREVSNLLVPYLSDSNDADGNKTTLGDENLINEHNIPKQNVPEIPRKEENRIYENVMCKMLNDCNINRRKIRHCNLCKKNFPSYKSYACHRYNVHKDVSVVHVCDNCNKVLTSVRMVNIHICTGRKVTYWNCKRCNQKFINGIRLMQHNVSYHFETAGPYTCYSCELSFLTKYMLEKHVSVHSSVSSQNSLLHNLNTKSSNIESNAESNINSYTEKNGDHPTENNISTTSYTKHLNESTETVHIFMNKFMSSLESNTEEMFKCKDCDIMCHTKKEMMFHLQKFHGINVDVCELCNRLYAINELLKHLINFHIVTCDFDSRKDNTNAELMFNRVEDIQQNIVKLLGLRRLITLYEYQRFNNIAKDNCFSCATCVMKFVSTQSYKIHYLQSHDTTCLLCNIEFKHQYQAFEHKIKIHVSADSYLWLIEKLTATILQFNKNGSSLDDVIVQYSKKRIHDNETYNNKFEELNDKEFEYELNVII